MFLGSNYARDSQSESHLGAKFFILDINAALDIFENVSVLGYADMTI
jgi:hypothetical protein